MNLTQIQGQWGAVFSNGTLLTILYVKDHASSFVVRALQKWLCVQIWPVEFFDDMFYC
jgi:hypothetical protein